MIGRMKNISFLVICFLSYGDELIGQNLLYLSDSSSVFILIDSSTISPSHFERCAVFIEDADCKNYIVFEDRISQIKIAEHFVLGDTSVFVEFFRSGSIKRIRRTLILEEPCHNSRKSDLYEDSYCENGQLLFRDYGCSKTSIELLTVFYCSGKKNYQFWWDHKRIRKVGKEIAWWENGQVEVRSFYNKDGKACGKWKFYDEKGKKVKIWYFDGKSNLLLKEKLIE
jgi:hypothetical protein